MFVSKISIISIKAQSTRWLRLSLLNQSTYPSISREWEVVEAAALPKEAIPFQQVAGYDVAGCHSAVAIETAYEGLESAGLSAGKSVLDLRGAGGVDGFLVIQVKPMSFDYLYFGLLFLPEYYNSVQSTLSNSSFDVVYDDAGKNNINIAAKFETNVDIMGLTFSV
ncbi:2-methylene-furan-3-one reductase-like [Olea europaea var. sylvestris]|uniref:2-methylene-furan-3-one reductase-like n=1 Tax=Olea europaea var. sylvestris TaxID=158386 RepID=UPI000C1D6DCC|nr:2-methylene-furan-3-one reductase-like [Olea europaea var. sylvestris]